MKNLLSILTIAVLAASCTKQETPEPPQPIIVPGVISQNVMLVTYGDGSADSVFTDSATNDLMKVSYRGGYYSNLSHTFTTSTSMIVNTHLRNGAVDRIDTSFMIGGKVDSIPSKGGYNKYHYNAQGNPVLITSKFDYHASRTPFNLLFTYTSGNMDSIDCRLLGETIASYTMKVEYGSAVNPLYQNAALSKAYIQRTIVDLKQILPTMLYSTNLPSKITRTGSDSGVYQLSYTNDGQGRITEIKINGSNYIVITY